MKKVLALVIALAMLHIVSPLCMQEAQAATQHNAETVVSLANQRVGGNYQNNMCLSFIMNLFSDAYGFVPRDDLRCCAYHNGNGYLDSTSRESIPLGACVYFAGSDVICYGDQAGHIGIYVGNNNIVHAWLGSIICTSIDYVINSGYTYRGYGWYANEPLSSDTIPVGAFDTATGGNNSVYVRGWAYDPDTPSASLNIHIYMDGQKIGETVANTKRTDVHQAHGCGENHGFEVTLPVTVTSTAKHTIKVYAINTNSSAGNKDLGSKEVTITAHTHSYTKKVTKAATCTQTGVETYTCSCNDKYTKTIPATGHSYTTVQIPVSGTTPAKTKYTCKTCGDTYTKYAESAYSAWSTTKPVDVVDALIETKTQYRYRNKQITTSTSSTLDGWTYSGKVSGDWGAVQTTTTKPTESDTLRITATTQTGWGYYHNISYYDGGWWIDSNQPGTGAQQHYFVSSYALPEYSIQDQGNQQSYGGSDASKCVTWTVDGGDGFTCIYNIWFRNPAADTFVYSYQTCDLVNQFYKWPSTWSAWSDQKVTSNDNRQVETRTLYRYVQTKRIGTNGTELVLQGDNWYYYKNGKVDTSNTLAKFDGKWYHLNGGKWVKDTGLVKYNNVWCYVKNGILNTSEDTLIKFSGKWYHVKDGRWQQGETKLYKYNGKWCYLKNGVLNTADTLVKISGKWYHVKGGTWQQGENGFYKYGGEWCYLQNGILKTDDTLVKAGGKWYHIKSGRWQQGETGFIKYNGEWCYLQNGILRTDNTLVKVDGKWYHINRGRWVRDTTKVYHGGKWHQVVNGIKV